MKTSMETLTKSSITIIVAAIVIIACLVVICVVLYINKDRVRGWCSRASRRQRAASLPHYQSFTLRGGHSYNPLAAPSTHSALSSDPALSAPPPLLRRLSDGTLVRVVPVHVAKEDAQQTWRHINISDLAGDDLRRVSTVPNHPSREPGVSRPRRGPSTREKQRGRRAAPDGHLVFVVREGGPREEDNNDQEGAAVVLSPLQDCTVTQQWRLSQASTSDRHIDREQGARGEEEEEEEEEEASEWLSLSSSSERAPPPQPAVWCALGIPQSQFASLSWQSTQDIASAGAHTPTTTTGDAREGPREHNELESTPATSDTLALSQEAMPWHPYRQNRRFLLVFPDGHSELTTEVEPWEAAQARHAQREVPSPPPLRPLRGSSESSDAAARLAATTTAVPVQSDTLETSSRSSRSLIDRLFSRQTRRRGDGQRSTTPASLASPPTLSPVEAALPTPTEASEVPLHDVAASVSPMNVIAPALVLVLDPLLPPPSPTQRAFLPAVEQVYGRGSPYMPTDAVPSVW